MPRLDGGGPSHASAPAVVSTMLYRQCRAPAASTPDYPVDAGAERVLVLLASLHWQAGAFLARQSVPLLPLAWPGGFPGVCRDGGRRRMASARPPAGVLAASASWLLWPH